MHGLQQQIQRQGETDEETPERKYKRNQNFLNLQAPLGFVEGMVSTTPKLPLQEKEQSQHLGLQKNHMATMLNTVN